MPITIKELKEVLKDLPDDMLVYKTIFENESRVKITQNIYPYIKRVYKDKNHSYKIAERPCKETKNAQKALIV